MTGLPIGLPYEQVIDENGAPVVGASIFTYVVGTTTPLTTYVDIDLTTPNANPIVTDGLGSFQAYGSGNFRFTIYDSQMNLIKDGNTGTGLPAAAVSDFMLPVLGSSNSTQFLDLSGTTDAINEAVAGVELLPGPAGPTGATGATGATGPAGPVGGNYLPVLNGNNPGYLALPLTGSSANFFIQSGLATTDGSGSVTVNFATTFPNGVLNVQLTVITNNADESCQLRGYSTSGIIVTTSGIGNPGGGFYGPMNFFWLALGY